MVIAGALSAPQQPSHPVHRADGWAGPTLLLLYLFVGFTEKDRGRGGPSGVTRVLHRLTESNRCAAAGGFCLSSYFINLDMNAVLQKPTKTPDDNADLFFFSVLANLGAFDLQNTPSQSDR